MARTLAKGERPLDWVGSSKKDFVGFPEPVKDEMGNALGLAQFGGKHPSAESPFRKGLSDRDGAIPRGLLKPPWRARWGPRPPAGGRAAPACALRAI